MKIEVGEECNGCGVCAKVCPQMILEVVDKKMQVRDQSRCMGCFGCEDECPTNSVRLIRAPQNVTDIVFEPKPETIVQCDVAVVGAGPAGVGAAITCAKAGLNVVVFERLPNRKLSHHTDGGVMFTLPWITSMRADEDKLTFPELDITINASFAKKCEMLGLMGPQGLGTQNDFPKGAVGWAGNKDKFVESLINEAETRGATFWFGAKVLDVLKEGNKINGVKLDSGEEIKAKVVVAADGVFAKISEKAGIPVNKDDLWYASLLAYEYDNQTDMPCGLYYFNGELNLEEDMPVALGGVGVTDVIHVLLAFLSPKKFYSAPKPMEYYLEKLLATDKRVHKILGKSLLGAKARMVTGCRGVFRGRSNEEVVGNGVISIGDAWVDDGELGNVPALANGVYAGRVIVEAAKRNDFSKESLSPAKKFINEKTLRILAGNKKFKLLPTKISEEEMKQMFLFMQHMKYPVLYFGNSWQKTTMFSGFLLKNFFRFFRYPKIARILFGKA